MEFSTYRYSTGNVERRQDLASGNQAVSEADRNIEQVYDELLVQIGG